MVAFQQTLRVIRSVKAPRRKRKLSAKYDDLLSSDRAILSLEFCECSSLQLPKQSVPQFPQSANIAKKSRLEKRSDVFKI